nr:MAG TPA: coagulation factor IX-binding protein [Caudoviricetes sp.]
MKSLEKGYEVKEWFANKVANEIGRNIYSCNVFAILKETPKAVYAMLNLDVNFEKCMWIPKSVLVECGEKTITDCTYEEAREEFKDYWSLYI